MRYSLGTGLALWTLFCATASCSADQQVLTNTAPAPTITADPAVLNHYSSKFSHWHALAEQQNGGITQNGGKCTGCNQGPGCCPPGGFASTFIDKVTALIPIPTALLPSASPWDSFSLPTTKVTNSPARTTIFLPAALTASSDTTAEPVVTASGVQDITSSYYAFTLAGQTPFELPLILTDGTATPVTVLAFVDTANLPSFISASLISQLNLTSRIVPHDSSFSSLIDLHTLGLARDTTSPGTITLDVLAGRNDRRISSARFVVFEPSTIAEGPLGWDLSVGMEFLNGAGAVQLTDEFAGIGVKEGLGVVVQRVYSADVNAGKVGHDEL